MAVVDWGLICDSAHFDRDHRLFMLGVETGDRSATMPTGIQRLTIVVRLRDRDPRDQTDPVIFMTPPSSGWTIPQVVREFTLERCGDYLLVQMPNVPFHEEGLYRFELALAASSPTALELSVLVKTRAAARSCLRGAF